MTGALLAAALAVLLWPDAGTLRRARLRAVRSGPAGVGPRPRTVPLPVAVAVSVAAVAVAVSTPVVAGLAGVGAIAGARSWQSHRQARRAEGRLRSLTEGLGALGAELRSGRSVEAATDAAVAACADDACGAALAAALRAPGVPVPQGGDAEFVGALRRIAAAVLLSARTGCSLAAVTAAVEDDLRARRRLRQELRTATAGPRASALLLAGLPVLGLVMGSGVGADPWGVLTTTGTGQVLLVAGVALEFAGLAWSARLVRRAVR
ncbi:type II secretion system F family protein [Blastococcus tunisiensis]|uniref:Tight adherence protein B n=1 Tax=Blastococcus tunisiensis TaxID=1798228 RepID=A0A1I1XSE7_9ACTN|nr:type II secretion system F family protein [Blastococcus sp. DSM 46838]SFE10265.1 tight adherence protein B [Blastococcus sp. DSM 46838]